MTPEPADRLAALAALVRQARRHGVRDEAVLSALGTVPRDHFVPRRLVRAAFDDGPLPIGEGQTISQPAMVALMVEAARIRPADRVLEVGTGSGYGAAMLGILAASVLTVERRPSLADRASTTLHELGFDNVTTVVGDGTLGWPDEAPYDAIVVTAAGPAPPPPLLGQLADGGRLVMPVGSKRGDQRLMRYTRTKGRDLGRRGAGDEPEYVRERLIGVRFVPLIGTHGFPE